MSTPNPLINYITLNKQDAVVYKARSLYTAAGDDIHLKTEAIADIKNMLACIDDEILLEFYAKFISAIIGIPQKSLAKAVKTAQDFEKRHTEEKYVDEGFRPFPKWVDADKMYSIGFDEMTDALNPKNTGIYFHTGKGVVQRLTNFIMEPIVQIISEDENNRRRITELSNGRGKHVFELPSAAFTSTTRFETILMDKGVYFLEEGFTQSHLNKLKSFYLEKYPVGFEMTTLGWQDEGFFAFSNAVYKGGIKKFNEYGLVDVEGTKYLSMGASNVQQELRKGTDSYKNDKHLFFEQSPISFKTWTQLMLDVYEDKAMMGISWVLLAINRDVVLSRSNYCPLPYCYGSAGSGKSKFVESIIAAFLKNQKLINLNQVSIFAFWESAGRFRNVPMGYNEFDPMSILEAITKAFKGMAEGEGRLRGTGKKNKSETQEVNCLPMLLGQYLATIDDGSILSRTLAEKFVERTYPEEQQEKFSYLKKLEKGGLSGLLLPVLQHRPEVEENYLDIYKTVARQLRQDFANDSPMPKERILENYTVVLTLMKIYMPLIDMAFTYERFYTYCKNQIRNLNTIIGESNTLGDFWQTLESLGDRPESGIEPGWDYKVETVSEVNSILGDKSSKKAVNFDKPTRLLFLRLKTIYVPYAKEKRNVTGKVAIPEATIKSYLSEQPYFIGTSAGSNFRSKKYGHVKNTSSMVFNYDMLAEMGVNLMEPEEEIDTNVTFEGLVRANATIQAGMSGADKVKFELFNDLSHYKGPVYVEKVIRTYCYWNELDRAHELQLGMKVKVVGKLSTSTDRNGRQWRNMEVKELTITQGLPDMEAVQKMATIDTTQAAVDTAKQLSLEDELDPNKQRESAF